MTATDQEEAKVAVLAMLRARERREDPLPHCLACGGTYWLMNHGATPEEFLAFTQGTGPWPVEESDHWRCVTCGLIYS